SYLGNGKGQVRGVGQVGHGWLGYQVISGSAKGSAPGQIFARDSAGNLYRWVTNARGGVMNKTKVGHGWQIFDQVLGGTDLTGNGHGDLLGWKADGTLTLYQGQGGGRFQVGRQVGFGFVAHSSYCPKPPAPVKPPPAKPAATPVAPSTARHVVKYQVALKGNVDYSLRDFGTQADQILNDPNGWARSGIYFQQVSSGGSFTLWLSENSYLPSFGYPCSTYYSCSSGRNVIINFDRWRYGAAPKVPIGQYRTMVVNHEVGHWLGHGHRGCPGAGRPAPLMMQQSKGLGVCTFNPYPLANEVKTPRFG
ncbi:MAG: DUF3152 domain-containing protein, partial [Micrococcales bacterium]|nr:DUF3152 domain-containing protein [Micrococcales bacterium]